MATPKIIKDLNGRLACCIENAICDTFENPEILDTVVDSGWYIFAGGPSSPVPSSSNTEEEKTPWLLQVFTVDLGDRKSSYQFAKTLNSQPHLSFIREGNKLDSSSLFTWGDWIKVSVPVYNNEKGFPTIQANHIKTGVLIGEQVYEFPVSDIINSNYQSISELKTNKAAKAKTISCTLLSSGWSVSEEEPDGFVSYSQTITGLSIASPNHVFATVEITSDSHDSEAAELLEEWNNVDHIEVGSDYIIAYCFDEVPTIDLPIRLEVLG